MIRRCFAAVVVVAVCGLGSRAGAHTPAEAVGFEFPESVYWDGAGGAFYVSNFGGDEFDPVGREEDGYLSKLSGEGEVEAAEWVTGLRSPKGIRRSGDFLYVADVGQVVVVDIEAAAIETTIDLDAVGAEFPNDVAVDDETGDVYVSDMLGNAIFRLPADPEKKAKPTPEVWLESPDLESPNGLYVDDGVLLVAAFGRDLDPKTFQPEDPGRVLTVDLETKEIAPYADMEPIPGAQLDGLEKLGDTLVVTDNPGGRVLLIDPAGEVTEAAADMPGAADLGLRRGDRVAAIPDLDSNVVRFLELPAAHQHEDPQGKQGDPESQDGDGTQEGEGNGDTEDGQFPPPLPLP